VRPVKNTKRSRIDKKSLPLPLQITYQPGAKGTYDFKACDFDYENKTVRMKFVPEVGPSDMEMADPWAMRAEFLAPDADWQGMTLKWGRFGVGSEDILEPVRFNQVLAGMITITPQMLAEKALLDSAPALLDAEFLNWQSLVRTAMTTEMTAWPRLKTKFSPDKITRLCRPMPLEIKWRRGLPAGVVSCSEILPALFATLQIDALMGAERRFCAYAKCGKEFRVTRFDQRYCPGTKCRHNQVVRNSRDRQRKATPPHAARDVERKSE
jgi:hypothetical protein